LRAQADGSVIAYEYGGGSQNRFKPVSGTGKNTASMTDAIIHATKLAGATSSQEEERKLREDLTNNAERRSEEWENYRAEGVLSNPDIPIGTVFLSQRFSYQTITRVPEGYIRAFDSGRIEFFDESGLLVRISDRNGNFISIRRIAGRIARVSDNFSRNFTLTYNKKDLLDRIEGSNGERTTYLYNDRDELIESTDTGDNRYQYEYSSDGQHNLTRILYSDGTSMEIDYYGRDKYESLKSVKDRDGTLTKYLYDSDPENRNHYKVGFEVVGADTKPLSSSLYEYFTDTDPDGVEKTKRLITTLDGDRTDTFYNENGLPLSIAHGQEETSFRYDPYGRVIYKDTAIDTRELEYDPNAGRVSLVRITPKSQIAKSSWSRFRYDDRSNLIAAENSDGQQVTLDYDEVGRIRVLHDEKGKSRIEFEYNENSKPVVIRKIDADGSTGAIKVTYAMNGETRKVESPEGRKVALAVTSAFQSLLDIIRPAGVNLSF
jgi:YD repeat-containing protein